MFPHKPPMLARRAPVTPTMTILRLQRKISRTVLFPSSVTVRTVVTIKRLSKRPVLGWRSKHPKKWVIFFQPSIVIHDISKHWDLRALYLLLIRYHQMHKDEQVATVNLLEKTKLYQDALRKADKRQQEIGELKQTIEDLKDKNDSNEVKWAVREKQLAT
jgi:hypothetical protein